MLIVILDLTAGRVAEVRADLDWRLRFLLTVRVLGRKGRVRVCSEFSDFSKVRMCETEEVRREVKREREHCIS